MLDTVLSGAWFGALYAMAAAALSLLITAGRTVNFAQGDQMAVLGLIVPGLVFGVFGLAGPVHALLIGSLVAILIGAVAGAVSLALLWPFVRPSETQPGTQAGERRPKAALDAFVAAIAIGIAAQTAGLLLFGPAPQSAFLLSPGNPMDGLLACLLAGGAVGLVILYLHRTRDGRAMRAQTQLSTLAQFHGLNPLRLTFKAYAVSFALVGLAGYWLSLGTPVSVFDGADLVLKAYAAVALAGWGRVGAAAAVAFALGIAEALLALTLTTTLATAVIYGAMIAILIWRPHGVSGAAVGQRV